jgi:hypothetical protein
MTGYAERALFSCMRFMRLYFGNDSLGTNGESAGSAGASNANSSRGRDIS